MSLSEIKKRVETLAAERIQQTDQLLAKVRESGQHQPSVANDLTRQSLEHRREKLTRN